MSIFTHKETGTRYRELRHCQMKDPVSREWLPCVLYQLEDATYSTLYVREEQDFYDKFEIKSDADIRL